MTSEPLVTISTPCYNHEKYLPDYFGSVISQTYKNIELIIIDDASKDNSQKIIENYLPELKKRFRKVIYIPRKKNLGVVKNMNEIIDLMKGKYRIGCASDDIMLPIRVEENVKFLENNKEYGMVYSDAYIFEDWIDFKNINLNKLDYFSRKIKFYSGNIMSQLLVYNFIPAIATCVRKNVLDKVGKYNEDYCFGDYDMWLKIAEKFKIGYIDEKLVLYRVHNESFSMRRDNKIKILKDKERMINTHIKNGKYGQKYVDLAYINIFKSYMNCYLYNKDKKKFKYYFKKFKLLYFKDSFRDRVKINILNIIISNNILNIIISNDIINSICINLLNRRGRVLRACPWGFHIYYIQKRNLLKSNIKRMFNLLFKNRR